MVFIKSQIENLSREELTEQILKFSDSSIPSKLLNGYLLYEVRRAKIRTTHKKELQLSASSEC